MDLKALALRYQALERVDKHPFQRRARVHQARWREERGYPIGDHQGRAIGNYLAMPWAEESLANFLDDQIKDMVRREVQDPQRAAGKMYGRPRLYNNLLSSQPLVFNLFAHLAADRDLATTVLQSLSAGVIHEVTEMAFEHSPGRGDPQYTGDRSAFDVYIRFLDATGLPAFAGIEVKYHEDLGNQASGHQPRYDAIAEQMACFKPESLATLRRNPLQQIWRDHLLAGIHAMVDDMPTSFFAILAPQANAACQTAITAYRDCLRDGSSFQSWSLEAMVDALRRAQAGDWVELFYERYLAFDWIDSAGDVSENS